VVLLFFFFVSCDVKKARGLFLAKPFLSKTMSVPS
jgi:hypothetical protein